jgi:hypothetical protein
MPSFGLGHDRTSRLKITESANSQIQTIRTRMLILGQQTAPAKHFPHSFLQITRRIVTPDACKWNRVSCHLQGGKSRKTLRLIKDSKLAPQLTSAILTHLTTQLSIPTLPKTVQKIISRHERLRKTRSLLSWTRTPKHHRTTRKLSQTTPV